jgi:DNA-binding transcriptional regulator PaaX
MDDYYQSERLTYSVIKKALQIVQRTSGISRKQLKRQLWARLSQKQQAAIAAKGKNKELGRIISNMLKQGYLEGDASSLSVSFSGAQRLKDLATTVEPLFLAPGESWDGLWRVITFDIPESNRSTRDALRKIVRELGFQQLQRSVWIHPLPCEDILKEIQATFGVSNALLLLEVSSFDQSKEFQAKFAGVLNN